MRIRLLATLVCGLTLALSAPAVADSNPAQSAYSGLPTESVQAVQSSASSGTLPFTGIDLGALSAVALVLVATGLVLRWRSKPGSD